MISDKKISELTKKGIQMLQANEVINYPVTKDHMMGFLIACSGYHLKEDIEKIRSALEEIAMRIFI